jgi:hypothetical protein
MPRGSALPPRCIFTAWRRPEISRQQGRHAPRLHDLEEVPDAADGGLAEDELEEDAGATDD